jgi:peptidoglycan-associated lipoprotein
MIEGHCDDRGTNEYNLALGQRRAESAKKYLIQLGVSSKRIFTISYGEEKPLNPNQSEEAWAENRRDHFMIR